MTTEENGYFESIRQQVNSGFLNYFDVKGKTILDVGVDVNLTTSKEFMAKGAKKVVASNPFEYKKDAIVPEDIEYLEVGAENVDFGNGFFDIIYGNSILEHIINLHNFLDRVLPKLKSGGLLYLEGSPFWTGPKGHHLYLNIPEDNVFYSVQGNCPISDYEHLVYKK